jgi:hypothetical protein
LCCASLASVSRASDTAMPLGTSLPRQRISRNLQHSWQVQTTAGQNCRAGQILLLLKEQSTGGLHHFPGSSHGPHTSEALSTSFADLLTADAEDWIMHCLDSYWCQ